MEIEKKTRILFNSSDKDINDYPIEEASLNPETGDIVIDFATQTYKKTGTTLTWSIKAGEKVEFPAYVANYLQSIYGFLHSVNPKKVKSGEVIKQEGTENNIEKDEEDGNDSTQ